MFFPTHSEILLTRSRRRAPVSLSPGMFKRRPASRKEAFSVAFHPSCLDGFEKRFRTPGAVKSMAKRHLLGIESSPQHGVSCGAFDSIRFHRPNAAETRRLPPDRWLCGQGAFDEPPHGRLPHLQGDSHQGQRESRLVFLGGEEVRSCKGQGVEGGSFPGSMMCKLKLEGVLAITGHSTSHLESFLIDLHEAWI